MRITEVWKDCLGYEEYLQVSNKGNVYRKSRYVNNNGTPTYREGRVAKTFNNGIGYIAVKVSIEGKSKNLYIHRLVLQTFVSHAEQDTLDVNHKDGDKQNNELDNLEWLTHRENMRHARENGLMREGREHIGRTIPTVDKVCVKCSREYTTNNKSTKYCSDECVRLASRKVEVRPTKDELYELLKGNSFLGLGRDYGVSDTSVRKWCKSYGIPHKSSYYKKYM